MDYEPYDSSGTDDFPPPHQNRMSRGGRISGKGRPATFGSIPYPRVYEGTDMEAKIYQLEQEAYISILRAFKAQADAITWEKEGLITELRRELRLSNEEHRDLLGRVNADETIRRIREWRQSGGLQPAMRGVSQAVHDPIPSPSISASPKKQKIASSLPSQSFGVPNPSFHPQVMTTANQPSSSAAKRGPTMGAKGKKHKYVPAGASSMEMQYPSGPAGRGKFGNCISSGGLTNKPEGASFHPLIGRKVRTRWPDDNSFYEAVITNYYPEKDTHALVYDIGTPRETWEWVNLSEISPDDIQWDEGYGGPLDRQEHDDVDEDRLSPRPSISRGRGDTSRRPSIDRFYTYSRRSRVLARSQRLTEPTMSPFRTDRNHVSPPPTDRMHPSRADMYEVHLTRLEDRLMVLQKDQADGFSHILDVLKHIQTDMSSLKQMMERLRVETLAGAYEERPFVMERSFERVERVEEELDITVTDRGAEVAGVDEILFTIHEEEGEEPFEMESPFDRAERVEEEVVDMTVTDKGAAAAGGDETFSVYV